MVVAHLMGSIIAYDALRNLGREPGTQIEVPHFVTIGSPLGLPHVKGKIIEERDYDRKVRTPSLAHMSISSKWARFCAIAR